MGKNQTQLSWFRKAFKASLRICGPALLLVMAITSAEAQDDGYRIIHTFDGVSGGLGTQGLVGHADPAHGLAWSLYGVTQGGGICGGECGDGLVYRLSPPLPGAEHWTFTRIHVFQEGEPGGFQPAGPLTFDSSGAAYGTTLNGVYKLTPPTTGSYFWTKTTLAVFATEENQAYQPSGGVVLDASGAVYLAATTDVKGSQTGGVILKLTPPGNGRTAWTTTLLYQGDNVLTPMILGPGGGLIAVTDSILYGCRDGGQISQFIPPPAGQTAWLRQILYSFPIAKPDTFANESPCSGLVRDDSGALFGTTFALLKGYMPYSSVYRLQPPRPETSNWSFSHLYERYGDTDRPSSLTRFDSSGTLYGTTNNGLFRLQPPAAGQAKWEPTFFHRFADYRFMNPSIARDSAGTIYATHSSWYYDSSGLPGTAFEILPGY